MAGRPLLPLLVAATLLLLAGLWWTVLLLGAAPFWQRRHRTPDAIKARESKGKGGRVHLPTLWDSIEFGLAMVVPTGLALDGLWGKPWVFYAPPWSFELPWASLLQSAGAVVLFLSFALVTWCAYLVERFVYSKTPSERRLLQLGPYRYVRHPLYFGFFLFGVGLLLIAQNYVMFLSIVLLTDLRYAKKEEAELIQIYGEAYREYRRRTGAFVPRFRRL